MKYFISVIGVLAAFLFLCFCAQKNIVVYMVDGVTLGVMVLIIITVLLSAGLHQDFVQAFRFALGKPEHVSLLKLKRAKEAVTLTLKATIGFAVLITSISVIGSLRLATPAALPVNLAVSILGLVYSAIFCLLLIPIQAKIKIKIMEYLAE